MKWGRNKDGAKAPTGAGGVSFDSDQGTDAEATATGSETDAARVDPDADTGGVVTLPAEEASATTAAVPAKRAAFGRGSAKPKVEKPAKEPKAAKLPKAAKVKKVVDEPSLPITVVIDFFMGVTKEREAEILARAQIEKNFDAPNASYLYIQRWRDGIAVEMQEGGGKAYLPEVLAKLDEDPEALVAVAMSNRFAQVRLDPDTKSLETLLLVANQEPPETAFIALPTRPMKPFDRRGSRVFLSGIGLLAASSVAMLFSVGAFFIDTKAWSIPYVAQTSVKDLPMAQAPKIEEALRGGADCVLKMEYVGGVWTVTPGYDNGGTCGPNRPASAAVVDPAVTPDGTTPGGISTAGGSAPPISGSVPAGVPGAPGSPATGPSQPPSSAAIFGAPAGSPAGTPGAPVAPGAPVQPR
jgi:hypothetical protein